MIKVLFICHGNICRSPIGQMVLSELVRKKGLSDLFEIDSCATTSEETANPIYPPARRVLEKQSVPVLSHRARRLSRRDCEYFDYLICMDRYNEYAVRRALSSDQAGEMFRMLDFTDHPRDVDDPWYTGEFDQAYDEIEEGCRVFLEYLEKRGI